MPPTRSTGRELCFRNSAKHWTNFPVTQVKAELPGIRPNQTTPKFPACTESLPLVHFAMSAELRFQVLYRAIIPPNIYIGRHRTQKGNRSMKNQTILVATWSEGLFAITP